MKNLLLLLAHLLTTLAKLPGPVGARAIVADSLLMKQQLIGTTRREFLDHTLFWNAADLEKKLADFQAYYNQHRTHSSLGGATPADLAGGNPKLQTTLNIFR